MPKLHGKYLFKAISKVVLVRKDDIKAFTGKAPKGKKGNGHHDNAINQGSLSCHAFKFQFNSIHPTHCYYYKLGESISVKRFNKPGHLTNDRNAVPFD